MKNPSQSPPHSLFQSKEDGNYDKDEESVPEEMNEEENNESKNRDSKNEGS